MAVTVPVPATLQFTWKLVTVEYGDDDLGRTNQCSICNDQVDELFPPLQRKQWNDKETFFIQGDKTGVVNTYDAEQFVHDELAKFGAEFSIDAQATEVDMGDFYCTNVRPPRCYHTYMVTQGGKPISLKNDDGVTLAHLGVMLTYDVIEQ